LRQKNQNKKFLQYIQEKAYGVIAIYKESENWLNDGSLEVIVKVPSGMIMDFMTN